MTLLSVAIAFISLTSCDDDDAKPKATYVLVHGAWQAPYVWETVSADLQAEGHTVVLVELPGHGSDKTPTYTLSLDAYRDKVIEAINKIDGQVILVGHSMGGMVVTHVAEKIPTKISRLVYIGAFVPTSGQTLGDLSNSDPGSQLGPNLTLSDDHLTLDVARDKLTYLFINDGTQADKDKVLSNYRAEPSIPFGDKVTPRRSERLMKGKRTLSRQKITITLS
ncbi:MAG: alpha/beta fold hydrolase [Bacteroidota bacterium]